MLENTFSSDASGVHPMSSHTIKPTKGFIVFNHVHALLCPHFCALFHSTKQVHPYPKYQNHLSIYIKITLSLLKTPKNHHYASKNNRHNTCMLFPITFAIANSNYPSEKVPAHKQYSPVQQGQVNNVTE